MNRRNTERLANLLSMMDLEYPMRCIEEASEKSSALLIEQGWEVDGSSYELGDFLGDLAELEVKIGRKALRSERRIFESCIKVRLDDACETSDGVTS